MSWFLQALPPLVAAQWLLGGALVLLAALVMRARPSLDAGTRHLLWNGLLVLLCALPLLVLGLAPRSTTLQFVTTVDAGPVQTTDAPPVAAVEVVPPTPSRVRPTDWPSRRALEVAFASLWALFVVLRLGALARSAFGLFLLRRGARPLPATAERQLRHWIRDAGVSASPPLVEVDGLRSPAVLGPIRDQIALPPQWIESVGADAQHDALLHEVAHCLRHDPLAALLRQIVCAFLPLNPAAGWARRQAELECELACDDWAMLHGSGSPDDFAESLLECASAALPTSSEPSTTLVAAFLDRRSSLHRRLVHMTSDRARHLHPKTLVLLACLLVFAAVQGASAWPGLPLTTVALSEKDFPELSADSSRLFHALQGRDWERVRELIDSGSEVNQIWPGDGSPLIVAARQGNLDIVQLLLDLGAEPDLAVAGDGTPLINASAEGHLEVLDLLLSYGADIDHHGHGGDGNPLIAASMAGDLPMVQRLVDGGAQIDIHVIDDDTPLINAVQQGVLDVVQYLLDQGADPNLTGDADRRSGEIRTPLNQATRFGHRQIERLLRAAGAR
ncbi:MAG: ankyrin repeat domain-containing protein [Acidobacteriota bacterium]